MRKALGCVLSAAVLMGTFGAPIPAWSKDPSGSVASPLVAPTPAIGVGSEALRQEAVYGQAAWNITKASFGSLVNSRPRVVAQAQPEDDASAPLPRVVVASEAPLVEPIPARHVTEEPASEMAAPANESTPAPVVEPVPVPDPAQPAPNAAPTNGEQSKPESPQTSEPAQPSPKADSSEKAPEKAANPASQAKPTEQNKVDSAESASLKSCVFSGVVADITGESLRITGQDASGQSLPLDFIVDAASQVAEGIKVGDTLVVYYEVASTGGYRVTSARYASGDLPKNIFPSDLPQQVAPADKSLAEDKGKTSPADADVPRVVSIEVEGNKTVSSEDVLQVVSTRIGDPLLDPRIRRDMQAIFDSGYYTDVRLDTRYAPGGVKLVFRVLENPVVNEIEIVGNNVATTEKLRELVKTKTGSVLNTRVLQSDLQDINKYYNEDLGYTVTPSHITKLDFTGGKLTISVVDGVVVKNVEIKGVTVFPKEKVLALVHTKPGDLFNRNVMREDSDRISKLYEDSDYMIDTIKPWMDVETGTVTLTVIEAVLQEIKLVGNTRTKDDTILRNLRSKPGEVMRNKKIQRDLERLNNLGLFKKVEPDVEPGSAPGQAILVLNIEEQKTGMATVGVGYAGGGSGAVRPGITGAISFSERNLFGEGKSGSINLQRGAQIGAYGISYYDPAINKDQDSLGISAYYNSVDEVQQSVSGADYGTYAYYDQKVYGATVTYGHPFTDDLRGFVTLRHETIDLKPTSDTIYLPLGMGKGDLNSIGLSALYDTRDDVFTPHHGSYVNASFSYAGSFLGGSYDYTKFVMEARHYVPVSKRSTLALRGMYGSTGNGSPASEYFYAGGTDTLRGYKDNAFFGTKLALLNAEYRFPIGNIKMLNGAVFVDAGNAWITGRSANKLYTDAGIGLRIVFPTLSLGVIRIDYAFGQDGSRSSIGIGQSF